MMIKYLSILAVVVIGSLTASAQSPGIVGAWVLTKAEKLLPDGTRVSDYGENPHGLVIFTADGYYSVQIYRAERLKFSSGDKLKGTPDEYKEASLSTSVHFGRYSMDPVKHTIAFRIDRSSFPNQDETTQVRSFEMKGDELSWKVAPRPDGSIPITVLRRAGGREQPKVKGLQ
jgi:Lipocalin-like domain